MFAQGVCVCARITLLHEIRSEVVEQGTEGEAIPPRCGEVGDLDAAVVLGHLSAPDEQRLTGIRPSS